MASHLTGLPDWASHAVFTMTASTSTPAPPGQMLLMRRLLAERFQLQVEETRKQQPVWDLVVASGGSKLKPLASGEECPQGINSDGMKAAGAPPNATGDFNGCTIADLVKHFNGQASSKWTAARSSTRLE